MRAAILAGGRVLEASGTALDAVEATVRTLESNPAFNAGLGSVANSDGEVEMDAALMEGTSSRAGAVAVLHAIRHPIEAARKVLEAGVHLFYAGEGAERFAREAGLEAIDPESLAAAAPSLRSASGQGTVGAVALDHQRCALSTTGHGESFMRCVFAHSVAERLAAGASLEAACAQLMQRVAALGGEGGCIAVDPLGNVALPHDTPIMPRAVLREGAAPQIEI
jgi:isoaspartyl peptidase/L-asparaginase-like protein (Ntn-hydrolase superfamily)